ncbi:unnamed protein product [Lathyrus sativus]|nr:unnamed protein product [Lathyrus sativus]
MEQEQDTSPMSPFWLPKPNNHRRLRRTYSIFLTSTSFLVLVFITALVFAVVVVPTLRSFSSNIFKPQAVKHSWDYLNLILVLFAVVCGFLTKNDTNETQTQTHTPRFDRSFSNPNTPPSWYQNSDRSFNRLRSVGSYPDLRQPPSLEVANEERYRFYDDTHFQFRHRYSRLEAEDEVYRETVTSGEVCLSPMRLPEMEPVMDCGSEDDRGSFERLYEVETIEKPEINHSVTENTLPPPLQPVPVGRKKKTRSASTENAATFSYEEFSSPPLQPLPVGRRKKTRSASTENAATFTYEEFSLPVLEPELNLPPVTRTKPVRRNVNRTYQSETIDKFERNDFVAESSQPPPAVAPPLTEERKIGIPVKKKRGNATKEFLTSLRGKKKKQRQKSVENFETIQNSQPFPHVSLPPGPPPPPPPPSVFHNMFYSNKSKHKKHYLVPVATHKPQFPTKREHSNYRLDKNVVITGNESPLIPIPPPPPPPPFKLPAWKFRVQGDYVRVDSIGSSRSGSPDSDENENVESPISQNESSQCSNSPYAQDGEENVTKIGNASEASLFCPSPDVDTKAHNFIQNFRAGLRMAKMNSMKEKQGIGRSNLGPIQN